MGLELQLWTVVFQIYTTLFKCTITSGCTSGKVYSNSITDDRRKRADCYVKKRKHNFLSVPSRFHINIWKSEKEKSRCLHALQPGFYVIEVYWSNVLKNITEIKKNLNDFFAVKFKGEMWKETELHEKYIDYI